MMANNINVRIVGTDMVMQRRPNSHDINAGKQVTPNSDERCWAFRPIGECNLSIIYLSNNIPNNIFTTAETISNKFITSTNWSCPYRIVERYVDDMFFRFDTLPECDGQTDRPICLNSIALCMLTRDEKTEHSFTRSFLADSQSASTCCWSCITVHDIDSNSLKCQGITFGKFSQSTPAIHANDAATGLVPWVSKMKYLGLSFTAWNCETDLTNTIGKYYGKLNNILSVLRRKQTRWNVCSTSY